MSASLDAVLAHGERERDAQTLVLQRAQQALQRLHDQGEQLRRYSAELAARAPGADGRPVAIDELRRHRDFALRVEQAVALQQAQAQAAERRRDAQQAALLALQVRLTGLRRLVEQRQALRLRAVQQREQRHVDDATAQRLRRSRPPAPETVY